LRKEALYIRVADKHIGELCEMPVKDLIQWFDKLVLSESEQQISKRILIEINHRLKTLMDVGLGYLTMKKVSASS
jgi:excinuclease ABC subunit A